MTGVLLGTKEDRENMTSDDGGRGGNVEPTRQRTPTVVSKHRKVEAARKGSPLQSQRAWLCHHLNVGLLDSRTEIIKLY